MLFTFALGNCEQGLICIREQWGTPKETEVVVKVPGLAHWVSLEGVMHHPGHILRTFEKSLTRGLIFLFHR